MVSWNFLGLAGDSNIQVWQQQRDHHMMSLLVSQLPVHLIWYLIPAPGSGFQGPFPCCDLPREILIENQHNLLQRQARNTINKYGLGSCGPRGFYGTIDVHLTLEQKIAKFMGTQESIIYAYDLATVPSVLPAFASAKDLIICDEVSRSRPNYCNRASCWSELTCL